MSKRYDVIELYRKILPLGGLLADDEGRISFRVDDLINPLTIDGKRLVLPTLEQQRRLIEGNTVIFHPMAENTVRPEDTVMSRFRQTLNVRMNYVITVLMEALFVVATSPKLQEQCKPETLDLMRRLAQVDEKLLASLRSINMQIKAGTQKAYINIYLRRGGEIDGKKWARAAIVTSPFMEELEKDSTNLWGVKLRKKDADLLRTALDFIVTGIDNPSRYNCGSLNLSWPSTEALLQTMRGLVSSINSALADYVNVQDHLRDLIYPSEWADEINELHNYKASALMVPEQDHPVEKPAPRLATPTPPAATPLWNTPVATQPEPVQRNANGTMPYRSPNQQPQQPQPGYYAQQPANPGWAQAGQFGQPMQSNVPPSRDPRAAAWSSAPVRI